MYLQIIPQYNNTEFINRSLKIQIEALIKMVRSKIHIERTGACSVVVEAEVVDEFDLVEVDDNGD